MLLYKESKTPPSQNRYLREAVSRHGMLSEGMCTLYSYTMWESVCLRRKGPSEKAVCFDCIA